jgi:RsiW-degrading membrane proteinase PrsW (M82 family)
VKQPLIRRRWFQVLASGCILFFASEQALIYTGDINFVPVVIMLGAFVVPITFVTFFYSRERTLDRAVHGEQVLITAATCFLVGGAIGVVVAGFLEYATLRGAGPLGLFGVGLIEEAAKLLFPIALFIAATYKSEADGLLFGVASGMGFGALETMGYGLVSLIQSQGDLGVLEQVLLVRGLLSPLGHAAWTGLVCAALWYGREKTGSMFYVSVIGVFILVVTLHALWDVGSSASENVVAYVTYVAVGGLSLGLLLARMNQAVRTARLRDSQRFTPSS